MHALLITVGLLLVTLGAEFLVRGASTLALRAGVSPLFIGLTIVGFGTSAPELGASLVATSQGVSDVSVGNVVGSNLFNIAVILALTALVKPVRVHFAEVRREVRIAIAAAVVPWIAWFAGGYVPRWAGIGLLSLLAAHLVSSYRMARAASAQDRALAADEVRATFDIETPGPVTPLRDRAWVNVSLVVAGLALLVVGSRMFVTSAIAVAQDLGVSELVIGLTIVSMGTSLPELVTSAVAALRGNPDIALGNVLGSNIFNSFGILGTCAVVSPQAVADPVLFMDVPAVLLATLALIPIMRTGGVISRAEGGLLLAGYGVYLTILLQRGG